MTCPINIDDTKKLQDVIDKLNKINNTIPNEDKKEIDYNNISNYSKKLKDKILLNSRFNDGLEYHINSIIESGIDNKEIATRNNIFNDFEKNGFEKKEMVDDKNIKFGYKFTKKIEEGGKEVYEFYDNSNNIKKITYDAKNKELIREELKYSDINYEGKENHDKVKNNLLEFSKYLDDKFGTNVYNKVKKLLEFSYENPLNNIKSTDNSYDDSNKDKVKEFNDTVRFLFSTIEKQNKKNEYYNFNYIKNNLLKISLYNSHDIVLKPIDIDKLLENNELKNNTDIKNLLTNQELLNYLKKNLSIIISHNTEASFNLGKKGLGFKNIPLFNTNISTLSYIKNSISENIGNSEDKLWKLPNNNKNIKILSIKLTQEQVNEYNSLIKDYKESKFENVKNNWIKVMNWIYDKYNIKNNNSIPSPELIYETLGNNKISKDRLIQNFNNKASLIIGDNNDNYLLNMFDSNNPLYNQYLSKLLISQDELSKLSKKVVNDGTITNQSKFNVINTVFNDLLNMKKQYPNLDIKQIKEKLGYFIPDDNRLIYTLLNNYHNYRLVNGVDVFNNNLVENINPKLLSLLEYKLYVNSIGSEMNDISIGYLGDKQSIRSAKFYNDTNSIYDYKSQFKRILAEEILNRVITGRTNDEKFLSFDYDLTKGVPLGEEKKLLQDNSASFIENSIQTSGITDKNISDGRTLSSDEKNILTGKKYISVDRSDKQALLDTIKNDLEKDNLFSKFYPSLKNQIDKSSDNLYNYLKENEDFLKTKMVDIRKDYVDEFNMKKFIVNHDLKSVLGTNIYKFKDLTDWYKRSQMFATTWQQLNTNDKIKYAVFDDTGNENTDGAVFINNELIGKILYYVGNQSDKSYSPNMALKLVGIGNGGEIKAAFFDNSNYNHIKNYMSSHGIDMLVPKSAMKVNIGDSFKPDMIKDLFDNNGNFKSDNVKLVKLDDKYNIIPLEKNLIKEMPLNFLKWQQEEHVNLHTKGDALSQLLNNMTKINIDKINFNNKEEDFSKFKNTYNKLIVKLLKDNFDNINDISGNKFKDKFNDAISKFDTQKREQLLKVLKDPELAKFMSDDISKIILPILNDHIGIELNRIKYAQAPGIFLNGNHKIPGIKWVSPEAEKGIDGNRLYYIAKSDGTGYEASIVVPFNFIKNNGDNATLNTYLNKDNNFDDTKIDPELLKILSFRVPNNGKNMQIEFKIVGFTRQNNSNIIYIPKGVSKQMDSDFDIDALYNYFNEYKADKMNKLGIRYIGDNNYSLDDIDNHIKNIYNSELSDKNKQSILKNHLIDMWKSILSNNKVYEDYIQKSATDVVGYFEGEVKKHFNDTLIKIPGGISDSIFTNSMSEANSMVSASITSHGSFNTVAEAINDSKDKNYNVFNFTSDNKSFYSTIEINGREFKSLGEGKLFGNTYKNTDIMAAISQFSLDAMKKSIQLKDVNISTKTISGITALLGMIDKNNNALDIDSFFKLINNKLVSTIINKMQPSDNFVKLLYEFKRSVESGKPFLKIVTKESTSEEPSDNNSEEPTSEEPSSDDSQTPIDINNKNLYNNDNLKLSGKLIINKELIDKLGKLKDISEINKDNIDEYLPYFELMKQIGIIGDQFKNIRKFESITSNKYKFDNVELFKQLEDLEKLDLNKANTQGLSNHILNEIFKSDNYLGYIAEYLHPMVLDKLEDYSLLNVYNSIKESIKNNTDPSLATKIPDHIILKSARLHSEAIFGAISNYENLFPELNKGEDSKLYNKLLTSSHLIDNSEKIIYSNDSDKEIIYSNDGEVKGEYRAKGEYIKTEDGEDFFKQYLYKLSDNGEYVQDDKGTFYAKEFYRKNPYSLINQYKSLKDEIKKNKDLLNSLPLFRYIMFDRYSHGLKVYGIDYSTPVDIIDNIKNNMLEMHNGTIKGISDELKQKLKNFSLSILRYDLISSENNFTANLKKIIPEKMMDYYGIYDKAKEYNQKLEDDPNLKDSFNSYLVKQVLYNLGKQSNYFWDESKMTAEYNNFLQYNKSINGFSNFLDKNVNAVIDNLISDKKVGGGVKGILQLLTKNILFNQKIDQESLKDSIIVDHPLYASNGSFEYDQNGKVSIKIDSRAFKAHDMFAVTMTHELLHASLDRIMKLKDNVNLKEEYEKLKKSNPEFIKTLDKYDNFRLSLYDDITKKINETQNKDNIDKLNNAKNKIDEIGKTLSDRFKDVNELLPAEKKLILLIKNWNKSTESTESQKLQELQELKDIINKHSDIQELSNEFYANKKIVRDIKKSNSELNKLINIQNKMSSLSEFTAELLTPFRKGKSNAELRKYLNNIESDIPTKSLFDRALDYVKRIFRKMLGIRDNSKAEDALNFIIDLKNKFNVIEGDNKFDSQAIINKLKGDKSFSINDENDLFNSNPVEPNLEDPNGEEDFSKVKNVLNELDVKGSKSHLEKKANELREKLEKINNFTTPKEFADTLRKIIDTLKDKMSTAISNNDNIGRLAITQMLSRLENHLNLANIERINSGEELPILKMDTNNARDFIKNSFNNLLNTVHEQLTNKNNNSKSFISSVIYFINEIDPLITKTKIYVKDQNGKILTDYPANSGLDYFVLDGSMNNKIAEIKNMAQRKLYDAGTEILNYIYDSPGINKQNFSNTFDELIIQAQNRKVSSLSSSTSALDNLSSPMARLSSAIIHKMQEESRIKISRNSQEAKRVSDIINKMPEELRNKLLTKNMFGTRRPTSAVSNEYDDNYNKLFNNILYDLKDGKSMDYSKKIYQQLKQSGYDLFNINDLYDSIETEDIDSGLKYNKYELNQSKLIDLRKKLLPIYKGDSYELDKRLDKLISIVDNRNQTIEERIDSYNKGGKSEIQVKYMDNLLKILDYNELYKNYNSNESLNGIIDSSDSVIKLKNFLPIMPTSENIRNDVDEKLFNSEGYNEFRKFIENENGYFPILYQQDKLDSIDNSLPVNGISGFLRPMLTRGSMIIRKGVPLLDSSECTEIKQLIEQYKNLDKIVPSNEQEKISIENAKSEILKKTNQIHNDYDEKDFNTILEAYNNNYNNFKNKQTLAEYLTILSQITDYNVRDPELVKVIKHSMDTLLYGNRQTTNDMLSNKEIFSLNPFSDKNKLLQLELKDNLTKYDELKNKQIKEGLNLDETKLLNNISNRLSVLNASKMYLSGDEAVLSVLNAGRFTTFFLNATSALKNHIFGNYTDWSNVKRIDFKGSKYEGLTSEFHASKKDITVNLLKLNSGLKNDSDVQRMLNIIKVSNILGHSRLNLKNVDKEEEVKSLLSLELFKNPYALFTQTDIGRRYGMFQTFARHYKIKDGKGNEISFFDGLGDQGYYDLERLGYNGKEYKDMTTEEKEKALKEVDGIQSYLSSKTKEYTNQNDIATLVAGNKKLVQRILMQYKSYVVPFLQQRFGKESQSFITGDKQEGYIKTYGKLWNDLNSDGNFITASLKSVALLHNALFNTEYLKQDKGLQDYQIGNLRKMAMDVTVLLSTSFAYYMLAGAVKKMDKDQRHQWNIGLNLMYNIMQDNNAIFTPISFSNSLVTQVAMISQLEQYQKFISSTYNYMFDNPNKVKMESDVHQFMKAIPGFRQYATLESYKKLLLSNLH